MIGQCRSLVVTPTGAIRVNRRDKSLGLLSTVLEKASRARSEGGGFSGLPCALLGYG